MVWHRSIAVFVSLLGAGLALAGVWSTWAGVESLSWPSVGGVVLAAEMRYEARSGDRPGGRARPRIRYRYTVAGTTYESESLDQDKHDHWSQANPWRRWIEDHPAGLAGRPVEVFYDPDDPRFSVLETGPAWLRGTLKVGVGGFLVLLGVGEARRRHPRAERPDAG